MNPIPHADEVLPGMSLALHALKKDDRLSRHKPREAYRFFF